MAEKKPEKKFDKKFEKKFDKKFDKKPEEPKSGGANTDIVIAAIIAVVGFPLLALFFSTEFRSEIAASLATPLFYIKTVATVIAMVGILVAIYSFLRTLEIARATTAKLGLTLSWEHEKTEKNEQWVRVENYMRSENPSDWKIAILEADNILDEVVERMGYRGETLGERMKMIEPSDFLHLDEAWRAHKMRNEIAHKGGSDLC